jgi:2-polyprenyl-3-methyl-5-hydroxy-6-metoxy-1,4-benzoquinol methylase
MTLEIPEATEPVPCPLCGDSEGAVVGERGRFGMPVRNVCCATCATVYVSPRPTAAAMGLYYRSTYRKHYGGVGYIGPDGVRAAPGDAGYDAALHHWHSPQADNALLLGETAPGASVLEIGCRHGRTLELMRERRGIVPFGVEPGEAEAEEARRAGVDCFTGALEDFDPGSRRFDQVQWFHVLEHVHEPLQALLKLRSLLKPEGRMVVEVPNVYEPYGSLEGNFFQNVHLVSYSPRTLPALLRRAGFEPLRVVDGGALLVVARPSLDVDAAELPLPFSRGMLGAVGEDTRWVATRLGNYANLEQLAELCRAGRALEELTPVLLRCLSFPAFTSHLLDVCALFVERLVARGLVDPAIAVLLAVVNGPHPEELRAEFRTFAGRLGAPTEQLAAAG